MVLGVALTVAALLSFVSVSYVSRLALASGALAKPGRRHIHNGLVPKMGGLSIALGFFPAVFLAVPPERQTAAVLVSSFLVLAFGIYDDVRGLTWKGKLAVSGIATSVLIFYGRLEVRDLGNILGFGNIKLGVLSAPFTYFALFGVMNAANLIDGADGLLCGISLMAFLPLAILGYESGNTGAALLSAACLAAVAGFIPFNYPKARIFLGDTGSLFIGFLIGAVSLMLIRGGMVRPVVPPLVLLLPIFDTLRVMGLRILRKKHPFRPDKRHFHHLLIRSGMRERNAVRLVWVVSVFFAVFAIFSKGLSSEVIFISELSLMSIMGIAVMNLRSVKTVTAKGRTRTVNARAVYARGAKVVRYGGRRIHAEETDAGGGRTTRRV